MPDSVTVVGVNRTQDGSIAVAVGEDAVYSLQKERLSRRKHHWGRLGDLPRLYLPRFEALRQPVDLVVEGWSSDSEVENVEAYHAELRECLDLKPDARIVTTVVTRPSATAPATKAQRRRRPPPNLRGGGVTVPLLGRHRTNWPAAS